VTLFATREEAVDAHRARRRDAAEDHHGRKTITGEAAALA
jgi:hypothetical protein